MKIELHHLNLCTTDVPAMAAFHRTVLDLEPEASLAAGRVTTDGYAGEVAFVTDGTTQVHLAERDLGAGFRTKNAINPHELGHVAFRTDDIEAFKRRLRNKGIPFSDYGAWAMNGWERPTSPARQMCRMVPLEGFVTRTRTDEGPRRTADFMPPPHAAASWSPRVERTHNRTACRMATAGERRRA